MLTTVLTVLNLTNRLHDHVNRVTHATILQNHMALLIWMQILPRLLYEKDHTQSTNILARLWDLHTKSHHNPTGGQKILED